jgi:hypothetical protein
MAALGLTGGGATAKFLIIIFSGREISGLKPSNIQSSFDIFYKIRKASSGSKGVLGSFSAFVLNLSSLYSIMMPRPFYEYFGCFILHPSASSLHSFTPIQYLPTVFNLPSLFLIFNI